MTTMSPSASRNPASSAAAFPTLRRRRTTLTLSARSWSRDERRVGAVPRAVVDEHDLPRLSPGCRAPRRARRRAGRRSAPRRERGRRPRSRARAYPVCSVIAVSALLTVEEALARVLERIRPLDSGAGLARRRSGPGARRGRARRDRPAAAFRAPPWTASRCGPATPPGRSRSSRGSRPAGPRRRPLQPGEAMGIATGGVVPDGADAVVPIERVTDEGSQVDRSRRPSPSGANVRPRGGDVRAGDAVLAAGTRALPVAACRAGRRGVARPRCARRPRVAVAHDRHRAPRAG